MGDNPQNSNRSGHFYRRGDRHNLLHVMENEMETDIFLPREIKLIVIHCSATRCNVPFTLRQLEESHLERGFASIGYHYYLTQEGRIHHTRPVAQAGAHAKGFNRHSIGVCYEGGLDEQGKPTDTRTFAQKDALTDLLGILLRLYPGIQIKGHYQLSANIKKSCPCFDAEKEYASLRNS